MTTNDADCSSHDRYSTLVVLPVLLVLEWTESRPLRPTRLPEVPRNRKIQHCHHHHGTAQITPQVTTGGADPSSQGLVLRTEAEAHLALERGADGATERGAVRGGRRAGGRRRKREERRTAPAKGEGKQEIRWRQTKEGRATTTKGEGGVEKAAVVKGGGANGGVKGRRDEQPTAAKGEGEQKRRGRQR